MMKKRALHLVIIFSLILGVLLVSYVALNGLSLWGHMRFLQ